jgi:RNA polymerase sigma-70 factor, ECF subfamily
MRISRRALVYGRTLIHPRFGPDLKVPMVTVVARSIDGFDEILAAAKDGQEWAVACLYDALQPRLLRYLTWQESAVAEDLASDTWLAVAERIGDYTDSGGGEDQFNAWVFGIARRRLADHRRRSVRRRTAPVPDEVLASRAGPEDPAEIAVEKLSTEQTVALLTGFLPPDQAEVLMLRVVGGLSVEEAARVVGKRPGTVRVLQHRALRHLARDLEQKLAVDV